MKKVLTRLTVVATAMLIGYSVSSGINKSGNLALSIFVGATTASFAGSVSWFICDTKLTRQGNVQQKIIDGLKYDYEKLENTTNEERQKHINLVNQLIKSKDELTKELSEKQTKLLDLITEHNQEIVVMSNENYLLNGRLESEKLQVSMLTDKVEDLKEKLGEMTAQCNEFKNATEFKEQELKHFQLDFNENLEKTYQTRLKKEVDVKTDELFEALDEGSQLLDAMDKLMNEVYQKHQQQREYTLGNNERFQVLKGQSDAKNQMLVNNLQEINSDLQLRVNLLQKQIDDGLTQPILITCGSASMQHKACGNIINDFIQYCYRQLNIPFKGLQFEIKDEVVSFGLRYPKSQDASAIVETLKQNSKAIEKYLEVWKLVHIEYITKYDAIAVSYRVLPPTPLSDDDIYKSGLIPSRDFCDNIYKATDHTSGGKPTLRIMAATGEGKGICTKHLVNYFSQLPNWEIWVSDPIHGSEQDFWDCEKIAKNKSQARKAYNVFSDLHATRKDLKIDGFTSKAVVGVFDEFDKQHDDDDKETAAKIMTAIRHTRQRQILIGQTAEVGSNGWTWDEMKQCSLLVLGDSIGTLCKHLVKDLGWTIKKSNEVKRQYEKFSDWAEKKNESNPDIPGENRTRIGLLVVGSRYQFLELPIPHKGIVRSGEGIIRSSFDTTGSINTQTETFTNNIPHPNNDSVNLIDKPEITCTHCQSTNFKRNRRVANEKLFNYSCKSCKKTFTSWNNKLT
jgi:hypothetical protein